MGGGIRGEAVFSIGGRTVPSKVTCNSVTGRFCCFPSPTGLILMYSSPILLSALCIILIVTPAGTVRSDLLMLSCGNISPTSSVYVTSTKDQGSIYSLL